MIASLLAWIQDAPVPALDPKAIVAEFLAAGALYSLFAVKVTALIEVLKRWITKGWLDGKEQYSAFLIAPAGGALLKQFTTWYADVPWLPHMVICVIVGAVGAGWVHDKILTLIIQVLAPGRPEAKKKD